MKRLISIIILLFLVGNSFAKTADFFGVREVVATKGNPTFIVNENGTVFPIPKGANGPTAVSNGKGIQYTGGAGGNGLNSKVTGFRYMDPVNSGKYQYPNGYGSYNNQTGQAVNPITGKTIAKSDKWWHIH